MTVTLLDAGSRAAVPWKNGGGVTREVAAFPADAGLADFAWRISLADVAADGPFSAFAGYDRVITVVSGAGMALTVDGVEHVVDKPYEPFAFSGGSTTECRLLGGPIMDFNVMTRSDRVAARVEFGQTAPIAAATAVVVLFEGQAVVTDASGAELCRLTGPLDAALIGEEPGAVVRPGSEGGSVFAVVEFSES